MAVGAFQETRIPMSGQLRNSLLVYALVEEARHKIVSERMQMVGFRETILIVDTVSGTVIVFASVDGKSD